MSETQTMTLTEFLLARIAEDEALVDPHKIDEGRKWIAFEDQDSLDCRVVTYPPDPDIWWVAKVRNLSDAEHIAAYHPARVLAECEAKRRIVEQYVEWVDFHEHIDREEPRGAVNGIEVALEHLAAVYADHPDYREEWKP